MDISELCGLTDKQINSSVYSSAGELFRRLEIDRIRIRIEP